jgi:diadenosine tetraphosphate (Ap4A) HIT family hydrolase
MRNKNGVKKCEICSRIESIKSGKNRFFVQELKTGYVVLGDYQTFRGYTLFLFKHHVEELQELDPQTRKSFLFEMSLVAEAVGKVFMPDKLNYELLGNSDRHLHWHIFPRYIDDPAAGQPVWVIPKKERTSIQPTRAWLLEHAALLKKNISDLEAGDAK